MTDLTNTFHCQRCGACCKLVGHVGAPLPVKADGECAYLRQEPDGLYTCTIYDHRPAICRHDVMARWWSKKLGITEEQWHEFARRGCEQLRHIARRLSDANHAVKSK